MNSSITDTFEAHRSQLLGIAYRITGLTSEAEDIVQETFIKWSKADHQSIASPASWLVTVTTHMALDHLKSARVQREAYIGPWLPEPFLIDSETPEALCELDETITVALLVMLEQLSPTERAAFILHDIFHYSFDEIGTILHKTGASCRKLASRARSRIDTDALTLNSTKHDYMNIVSAFFKAIKLGDTHSLVSILREDVVLYTDGGGKAAAAKKILAGVETVARFLIGVLTPAFQNPPEGQAVMRHIWFNGAPGVVIWIDGSPVSAFNLQVDNHTIRRIHVQRNPDKLTRFYNTTQRTEKKGR